MVVTVCTPRRMPEGEGQRVDTGPQPTTRALLLSVAWGASRVLSISSASKRVSSAKQNHNELRSLSQPFMNERRLLPFAQSHTQGPGLQTSRLGHWFAVVENPPAKGGDAGDAGRTPGSDPWVRKMPQRREWQPALVFLPGESHGQRSVEGCSPRDRKGSDSTECSHMT